MSQILLDYGPDPFEILSEYYSRYTYNDKFFHIQPCTRSKHAKETVLGKTFTETVGCLVQNRPGLFEDELIDGISLIIIYASQIDARP